MSSVNTKDDPNSSTIVYYSSINAMDLFDLISNADTNGIEEFLDKNPKAQLWKYVEDNQYTLIHRIAFQQINQDTEYFFPVITKILDIIKKNISQEQNQKEYLDFLNFQTKKGYTALHYAAFRGNAYLLSLLITEGADMKMVNNQGLNIFHLAAQGNQPTTLTYIREKYSEDFPLDCRDNVGSTPLHWACYSGGENAVSFLLSWKANVNKQDDNKLTPLHLAVINERKKVIQKLLQSGANRNLRDKSGKTPYNLAQENNQKEIMNMLKAKATCCNCCVVKVPMQKIEKTNFNVVMYFLFFVINVLCNVLFSFGSIYLKKIDEEDNGTNYKLNSILTLVYIGLAVIIIIIYFILLCFDISKLPYRVSQKVNFLELIEKKISEKKNVNLGRFCPTCKIIKQYKMVHCFICNKCTPDFDHHCYWINKDVGKRNYKFFFLFIILMTLVLGFDDFLEIYNIIKYTNNTNFSCSKVIFGLCKIFDKKRKSEKFFQIRFYLIIINFLITGIFFIPILLLVCLNIRNIIYNKRLRKKLRKENDEDYISHKAKPLLPKD